MFDAPIAPDAALPGGSLAAASLPEAARPGFAALRRAIQEDFAGRIAVVSSFGAESAVLLALIADIDPATPILFIDTHQHFAETLAYRDQLTAHLGLSDVRTISASVAELRDNDPTAELWMFDPDACCKLRKVTPLDRALKPFAAWVTGRKRHQTAERAALPLVEISAGKTKINPLADWTADMLEAEIRRRGLPKHPLVDAGYPSIGCATCTKAVAAGDDPRSGRWAGSAKKECGIHQLAEAAGDPGL